MIATVYITLITTLLAVIAAVVLQRRYDIKKSQSILSIRESIMLTDFPILTFNNNGYRLRFLLDTGSNANMIDKNILKNLVITDSSSPEEDDYTVHSIGDSTLSSTQYLICFNYDSLKFGAYFMAVDKFSGFDKIKNDTGVEVNGILGAPFMTRYKYILDLDNLKVRINKR